MTKAEYVSAIAEKTGLTKKDVERFIKAEQEVIHDTLAGGDNISLIGFGKWTITERAARTGVNPQTKKPVKIPASKSISLKLAPGYKKL